MQNGLSLMQQDACNQKIELLYFDEAGFSCLPNVQRSWSPLAMPHTADASLGRKRANVMGALDYARNQLHYEICEHSVCRDDVLSFLDRLASASIRDKWTFIVLDNASMHHHIDQSILDRWILLHRFVPLYLPPYSPELNLIEILWKHAKYHWREFKSWSKDALVEEVRSLLDRFGQKFHISYA
jgi:transposase